MHPRISVAPMMGCTDRHCRYLFRLLSPNAMLYSEMLVSAAIIHGDQARLLAHEADEPCALQLGGSDPEELAKAAKIVEQADYQEVNLNCGCPSDRVQQGGIGACLMASPELVAECFTAMSEAVNIPVTIKSRIGIDDRDDFEFFHAFVDQLHAAGCRIFHIHARKAVLSGLSPKENREIPPLKYDYVRRIQSHYPDTTFVLNGGIRTRDQVKELLREFPGVMLGRAPYNDPYLLAEIEHDLYGTTLPDRHEIMAAFQDYSAKQLSSGCYLKHMTKHLFGMFTGQSGARAFRRHLSTHMNAADADLSVLKDALAHVG